MEEVIEVLIGYGQAYLNKRLHLFLEFPELRWAFQEIELRHLGGEHNKGKRSRLRSLLSRIIEIEIEARDLRWFFQEIELKDLAAQRVLVSPAQQHHKGKCSLLLSLLGDIFDIKVFKIIWKSLSPSQTQAAYLLNSGGTPWRKERSG